MLTWWCCSFIRINWWLWIHDPFSIRYVCFVCDHLCWFPGLPFSLFSFFGLIGHSFIILIRHVFISVFPPFFCRSSYGFASFDSNSLFKVTYIINCTKKNLHIARSSRATKLCTSAALWEQHNQYRDLHLFQLFALFCLCLLAIRRETI